MSNKNKNSNEFPQRQARELLDELPKIRPGSQEEIIWNDKASMLLTLAGVGMINYNSAREFEK